MIGQLSEQEIYIDSAKHLFEFSGYTNITVLPDCVVSDQAICGYVPKCSKKEFLDFLKKTKKITEVEGKRIMVIVDNIVFRRFETVDLGQGNKLQYEVIDSRQMVMPLNRSIAYPDDESLRMRKYTDLEKYQLFENIDFNRSGCVIYDCDPVCIWNNFVPGDVFEERITVLLSACPFASIPRLVVPNEVILDQDRESY